MIVAALTAHPPRFRARQRPATRHLLNLLRGVADAGQGEVDVRILAPGGQTTSVDIDPGIIVRTLEADVWGREPGDSAAWAVADELATTDVVHMHDDASLWEQAGLLAARLLQKPVWTTADAAVAGAVDLRLFHPAPPATRRDRVVFLGADPDDVIEAMERLPVGLVPVLALHHPPEALIPATRADGRNGVAIVRLDDPLACREAYWHALAMVEAPGANGSGAAWEMPFAEAMACGTPLVCRPRGGPAQVLEPGSAASDAVDWGQVGEALTRLAADPLLVAQRGEAGVENASLRLDLKLAGQRLLASYREMVAAA